MRNQFNSANPFNSESRRYRSLAKMIEVFDTVSKKLAIPVLVFFTLGWAVYTAGFGLVLNKNLAISSLFPLSANTSDPFYFPFHFTLAGGPFVVILGLLHAALPSNQAGAIIGVVSTILNNI